MPPVASAVHGLDMKAILLGNPFRAVTLPNIGVLHYIGVPHRVTFPHGGRNARMAVSRGGVT